MEVQRARFRFVLSVFQVMLILAKHICTHLKQTDSVNDHWQLFVCKVMVSENPLKNGLNMQQSQSADRSEQGQARSFNTVLPKLPPNDASNNILTRAR